MNARLRRSQSLKPRRYDERMKAWQDFYHSDPMVCGGAICATGTRVPITVVLDSVAEGASVEQILRSYPSLLQVHIEAALIYAAELAHEESLLPLRSR